MQRIEFTLKKTNMGVHRAYGCLRLIRPHYYYYYYYYMGAQYKHGVDHTIPPRGLLVSGLVALRLALATHDKVADLGGACQDTLNGP